MIDRFSEILEDLYKLEIPTLELQTFREEVLHQRDLPLTTERLLKLRKALDQIEVGVQEIETNMLTN